MERLSIEDYESGRVSKEEFQAYCKQTDAHNAELAKVPEMVTAVNALRKIDDILFSLDDCREMMLQAAERTTNKGVRVCVQLMETKLSEIREILTDSQVADLMLIAAGDPD